MKLTNFLCLLCLVFFSACGGADSTNDNTNETPQKELSKEEASKYQASIKNIVVERSTAYSNFVNNLTVILENLLQDPNSEIDFAVMKEKLDAALAESEAAISEAKAIEEPNSELAYKPTVIKLLNAAHDFLLEGGEFLKAIEENQTQEVITAGARKIQKAGKTMQAAQKEFQEAQNAFIRKYEL